AWSKADPAARAPALLRVGYLARAGQGTAAVAAGRKFVEDQVQAAEKQAAGSGEKIRTGVRVEVAQQLLGGGAYEAGEAWVNDLLKDAPDLLAAQLLRGDLLLRQKNYDAACELYRKVLEKSPGNLIAANNLAYILGVELNKPAEADAVIRATRQN